MTTDDIVVLLKNLEERKATATLKKARRQEVEARRSLRTSKRPQIYTVVQEFEEWGTRNVASITAALDGAEHDEWN